MTKYLQWECRLLVVNADEYFADNKLLGMTGEDKFTAKHFITFSLKLKFKELMTIQLFHSVHTYKQLYLTDRQYMYHYLFDRVH